VTSEGDIQRLAILLRELDEQRTRFVGLADELVASGGDERSLTGDWNLRDLVAHVAFWDHHAADALELAVNGRGDSFSYDPADTDRMNAETAIEAGRMDLDAARAWEDREFVAFRSRVAGLGPLLLDVRLGNDDTVENVIRYDGPDHYAEHSGDLEDAVRGEGD
jgi:hypothetical protein